MSPVSHPTALSHHAVTHRHAPSPLSIPGEQGAATTPGSSCKRRVAGSHGQPGPTALHPCPARPRSPTTPAAQQSPATSPRSPLLAPVTITVLPVRSVGHLRGSQARLLLAQRSSPRSSVSRNQHGWLQALGSSMAGARAPAGARGPAGAPGCSWGTESVWGRRSAENLRPAWQPWYGTVLSCSPSLQEWRRDSQQESGSLGTYLGRGRAGRRLSRTSLVPSQGCSPTPAGERPASPGGSRCRRGNAHWAAPRSPSSHAGTLGHEPGLEPRPLWEQGPTGGVHRDGGAAPARDATVPRSTQSMWGMEKATAQGWLHGTVGVRTDPAHPVPPVQP